jgi:transcriptional regulator with XRE-family HTH domain
MNAIRRAQQAAQADIRSALRRRRRALGLTQEQVAELLGMHRLAYHRIETGVRQIKFAELGRICAARASARLADVSVVAMRCDIRASSATVRYGIFNASAKGGRGKKAVPKTGFSMERQSNMGRT